MLMRFAAGFITELHEDKEAVEARAIEMAQRCVRRTLYPQSHADFKCAATKCRPAV